MRLSTLRAFSSVISPDRKPRLKVFFSALQCAAGIATGAATGGVTAAHAVMSCDKLYVSSTFGFLAATIYKNLENVQFPADLWPVGIRWSTRLSCSGFSVLSEVAQLLQLPDASFDRPGVRLPHLRCAQDQYAAEQSVGSEQVMFQDPSDLERAVTVLAGYREMLLQGLQLVRVEINTRCVAKQMDVAEKNSDVCDLSNVPLPADANINKCGDMLKKIDVGLELTDASVSREKGTACEVECDCGYKNKEGGSQYQDNVPAKDPYLAFPRNEIPQHERRRER